MEPLKNLYNTTFLQTFATRAAEVIPGFHTTTFLDSIFEATWEQRELKQRMRHIATVLKGHLPGSYDDNIQAVLALISHLQRQGVKENSIEYMFFPDFVETHGLEFPEVSFRALEVITQFTSCEFAVRPFIIRYQEKAMFHMLQWSTHNSHLVRRFSSEGSRPRLPWAMALPALKKDPSPIFPILENLKADPSEFVRRSVANNLNDIAKDHPQHVLSMVKRWKNLSRETDWVIKHGSRTLLRKADGDIMEVFGLQKTSRCEVTGLTTDRNDLGIGDTLHFSFVLTNLEATATKLRVEFGVHYMKANGKQNRKLFKITENEYEPGKAYSFSRHHSFRDLTTRKHYPGQHRLVVVVNGAELAGVDFQLT